MKSTALFRCLFLLLLLFGITFVPTKGENSDFEKDDGDMTQWPECKGMTGEEAEQHIKKENKELDVVIVPEDAIVTMDFRTDRVRIRVDKNGCVVDTPSVG